MTLKFESRLDGLAMWLAWKLPRNVVKWCAVRVAVHGCTGKWADQSPPTITVAEMLDRWEY